MSNGASFVKRSKPRSSASRISSAYDDEQGAEAGPSNSFSRTGFVNGDASSSVTKERPGKTSLRRTLAGSDDDDEGANANAPSVVFRARAKGVRGGRSSSPAFSSRAATGQSPAPSLKQRPSVSAMDEDDAEDDGDAITIRRSTPSATSTQSRRPAPGGSSLSATSATTPKRSTPLRPTSFQIEPSDIADTPSDAPSNLYTSKYLEELRSSTPTSRSRAESPAAPQPLGPGTRIDDPMVIQTSRIALDDPSDSSLARTKYPADFAHDAIPSESVIRAAKEKRARLRAGAAAASSTTSSDYISLNPSSLQRYDAMQADAGPHPHSRLQREEDELGDGADEFAEYTGATERLPIGERAEREWEERQRRQMEAAVRGEFDQDAGEVEDEMDEDEEEWERAQLRRTDTVPARSREASPFRPAPIPESAPLSAVGTCSTRLELTLRALEQSTAAAAAIIDSATTELETLDAAERENKLDVAAVEGKASWFDELDEFVVSLARFMEEKSAKVEEVEKQAMELLVKRNAMLGRRRGRWIDERLRFCFGSVPRMCAVVVAGEDEAAEMDGVERPVDVSQLDSLDAADELSFNQAQQEVVDALSAIFADVEAVEYLDPAAPANGSGLPFLSPHPSTSLHPRSLVSRFSTWRRLYPEEYAQVWGGLSLAQICEFYARLELVPWSPFHKGSSGAIAHFRWFTGASDYASDGVEGGDDEMLASIIGNVVVEYLVKLVREGGYTVWSKEQTREAVEVVQAVQTVLGRGHARCLSLGEVVVEGWRAQVRRLKEVLGTKMCGMEGGREEEAAMEVVEELTVLLRNLVAWERVLAGRMVGGETTMEVLGKRFVGLVEELVVDVIQPFAQQLAARSEEVARDVLDAVPQQIVAKSERLSLLTRQT